MINPLQNILTSIARSIIRKYQPKIIAITGSLGKSSAKEAAVAVINEKFHVRGSRKNYNNELGVPLTIIGAKAPGRSPVAWLGVFLKGLMTIVGGGHYPEILVLEMGADHPGDIDFLTSIARPDIAVVTSVAEAHTEFFGDLESVQKEKATLVRKLLHDGIAILNADDEFVSAMKTMTVAKIFNYGFRRDATVKAIDYGLRYSQTEPVETTGINFKIAFQNSETPIFAPAVCGKPHVYAMLAGASVGSALGMNNTEIIRGLSKYRPPAGRMNLISGIKETILIDDTYNSSPRACIEALETLRSFEINENSRRVAVLGDMLELGKLASESHRQVGIRAAEIGVDILVTVGEFARGIAHAAEEAGLDSDKIFEFTNRDEAGKFIQDRMRKGDVVLVKGSQGARMEFIVKELMAEPLKALELLVRQDSSWLS